MARILINAVSAKSGGARTIVESFAVAASGFPHDEFIVLAGFEPEGEVPSNVTWRHRPKSGVAAVMFSLFGVLVPYVRERANTLISFNNINTPLLRSHRRITYFHQLKALDASFAELKLRVIRQYLRLSSEPIVVQSAEVKRLFEEMFGAGRHEILVAWPGINLPKAERNDVREARRVLVPVASPQSSHKNFAFVKEVANGLGDDWRVIVTAPAGAVYLGPEATNIEFIGTLSRSELCAQFRRATVCLMGSTHETIGLPIFEALSLGTPVIAYDAPYIRAFRSYFGISQGLILSKTPADAAAEILAMTDNPVPRIVSAKDFCEAEWDIVLNKI